MAEFIILQELTVTADSCTRADFFCPGLLDGREDGEGITWAYVAAYVAGHPAPGAILFLGSLLILNSFRLECFPSEMRRRCADWSTPTTPGSSLTDTMSLFSTTRDPGFMRFMTRFFNPNGRRLPIAPVAIDVKVKVLSGPRLSDPQQLMKTK